MERKCWRNPPSIQSKIENRKIGCVSGVHGVLKWECEEFKQDSYEFLVNEYETTLPGDEDAAKHFAIHRCIRIHLKPVEGPLSKSVIEIFKKIYKAFNSSIKSEFEFTLACKPCQIMGGNGLIPLTKDLRPEEYHCCQIPSHNLDKSLIPMMIQRFTLKSLLNNVDDLGLEVFETSEVKSKMFAGEFEAGQQIWIYHNSKISPNVISRINPYAHVVIYAGPKEEKIKQGEVNTIHEVVHVSKFRKCCTLMKANIRKEDILKVIKPTDQIFIGHKLENFQFSANARERIVERALKCAKTPDIVFDYHPDQNCKTFCNAIVFNLPESTQAPETVGCVRGTLPKDYP